MPVKRRVDKGGGLDQFKREALLAGPDDVVLAGVGYCAGRGGAVFAYCTTAEQAAMVAEMRADWRRHAASLTADWIAEGLVSKSSPSWAEREFGKAR